MIGLKKNVVWKQKNSILVFLNRFVFREVRLCWNVGVCKFQVYCLTYLRHLHVPLLLLRALRGSMDKHSSIKK